MTQGERSAAATTATAAAATTPAALHLLGEGIGADVAHRGAHRIGLAASPAAAALATPLAATEAAIALDEALVVGLLQRVRDDVLVVDVPRALAFGVHLAAIVGLLQRVGDAAGIARLTVLQTTTRTLLALATRLLVADRLGAALIARPLAPAVTRPLAAAFARRLCTVVARPLAAVLARALASLGLLAARCRLAGVAALRLVGQATQRLQVVTGQVDPGAALEATRQHDAAVADADQATDGQADRVEELADLAVAAFGDDHAVPVVHPLAAAVLHRLEGGGLAFDLDTGEQALAGLLLEAAQHAHGVLALDAEARVHQLVGQVTRGGEQQQAFGVDVQTADRLPLAVQQARQAAEHGGTLLGVVQRDHFAHRLVVRDDAVAERDAHAHMGRLAVDLHAAILDGLLHVAARTDTRLGQHLVQLGRVDIRGQHALVVTLGLRQGFGSAGLDDLVIAGVEVAGQQAGEDLA